MLQSSSHLFDQLSKPWDTSFARKFLRIPEDQLKMIKSIPGWSAANKISVENEDSLKLFVDEGVETKGMGSALSSQNMNKERANLKKSNSSKENIEKCNSSIENVKNSNETEKNSLQLKKTPHNATIGRQSLLRSASLSILNQHGDPKEDFKLRYSNSAPNIYGSQVYNTNVTIVESDKLSQKNSKSSFKTSKLSKSKVTQDSQLNQTYLVQTVPENQELENSTVSHKAMNSSLTLGDHILNHKFFKEPLDIVTNKPTAEELYQNTAIRDGKCHNPVLDKRLRLLEKRFLEGFCITPEKNVNDIKIPQLSESVFDSTKNKGHSQVKNYVLTSSQNADNNCLKTLVDTKKTPNVNIQNLIQELETVNIQNLIQELKTVNIQNLIQVPEINKCQDISCLSSDTNTHCISQSSKSKETVLIQEESFNSQPIPCGQPLPPDLISQNNSSKSGLENLNKSKNTQENIPEELVQMPSHAAFLENNAGKTKTQNLASNNVLRVGTKRKRKNKGDTPKKHNSKNLRMIDIDFTTDQVKNMLDIIKLFNLED